MPQSPERQISKAKDVWLRFRSSNAFLYALVGFIATWFTARSVFHFDPDYTLLNVILSVEAAVATCMILDLQFRALYSDRATLQHISTLVEHMEALAEAGVKKNANDQPQDA